MDRAILASPPTSWLARLHLNRRLALACFLVAIYVVLDGVTYHFPGRFGVTPFNPGAAVGIAILMFFGLRYLPLVFLAAVMGQFVPLPLSLSLARPFHVALILSAILTAGYAAVAVILQKWWRIQTDLTTQRDVLRLIAVTLVCMLLCGIPFIGTLLYFHLDQGGRYFYGVRRFFIGYSVSILVAAPLIFMLFSAGRRRQIAVFFHSIEAWLLIAAVAGCAVWVFLQEVPTHVQNFYFLFLPVVWAATRFGLVGAVLTLVQLQMALYLLFYFTGYQPLSVFELQLMMIALVITGLLLGVVIDEQRRASEDFRESLKLAAAGEMAAAIAHEINQPLTALTAYATSGQLLAATPEVDRARLSDTMDKLMVESKRTAAVVRRLRDFFRSGATRLERVAIVELMTKVMDRLRGRAHGANVELTLRTTGATPVVLVDMLQIEVVLRNLIMNAIDSAAETASANGQVEVAVIGHAAGDVEVRVHDNGAGIAAADAERLFASFVTTKSSGMGMGLAISRAIIDAHGGRIWAVPGNTGEVRFTLPAANSPT